MTKRGAAILPGAGILLAGVLLAPTVSPREMVVTRVVDGEARLGIWEGRRSPCS